MSDGNASRRFEMIQSKRGQPSLRLHTLHPKHQRTRYVYAQTQDEIDEIADELVQEVGECGFEIKTQRGWDFESIYHKPKSRQASTNQFQPPSDYDLKELKKEPEE